MSIDLFQQKSKLVRLNIEELNLTAPNLHDAKESKSVFIAKWMMNWIDEYIKSGKISSGMLLPSKENFAYFLGVSVGTIQNSLRYIEDM